MDQEPFLNNDVFNTHDITELEGKICLEKLVRNITAYDVIIKLFRLPQRIRW